MCTGLYRRMIPDYLLKMAKDFPMTDSAERRALLDALGVDLAQLDRRTRAAIEALGEEVLALREDADLLRAAPAEPLRVRVCLFRAA